MIGWRQSRPNAQYGLPRDQAEHVFRLEKIAWLAVVVFIGTFALIDFGLMQLVDGPAARLTLRWLLIGGTCVALTFGLSRRTVNIFVQAMRGERAARNEAEAFAEQLGESEERYRRLVELCPDPIAVYCDDAIVYANQAALDMAGVERPGDFIGRPIVDFIHPQSEQTVLDRTRRAMEHGESNAPAELTLRRLDGELVLVEATTMPITFEGRPAIQAVMRDITVRKRAEAALAHQALHDALTGLPNRVLLQDRLQHAIATSKRDGTTVSLLLMDLDHFKEVNDTLGHHAGDLLLQQVGIRLRGTLRQADTIARLGGDEFAVILPDTGAAGVNTVVENLRRRLQAPYSVENQPVVVGASIGVAHSPTHGDEADTLMRRADVAMYVAKRSSVGFATYHADQDRHSPDRLSLIGELQRAVDEGELVLHYQPKLDLRTQHIVGVEALIRWEHPLRGLLAPDQFIPTAEQAGLIGPLSRWVLRAALVQVNSWRRIGLEIPVAVNLSMRSFRDEQLPDKIRDLLDIGQTPAHLLMLEITESTLMVDPPRTLAILNRLREMGIRVAIDDFGTGHSSLAYLKQLPVDEIKIDRSFIHDIATDETDRVIVRCTVDLAHSLGLRVVAEGVEDAVTHALVAELGCDEAQGFYLSPALRGRALTSWISQQPLAA
jgi:diguanylate cyclase (GGDEF)-like protein/PAS domain S-box-containing protein